MTQMTIPINRVKHMNVKDFGQHLNSKEEHLHICNGILAPYGGDLWTTGSRHIGFSLQVTGIMYLRVVLWFVFELLTGDIRCDEQISVCESPSNLTPVPKDGF